MCCLQITHEVSGKKGKVGSLHGIQKYERRNQEHLERGKGVPDSSRMLSFPDRQFSLAIAGSLEIDGFRNILCNGRNVVVLTTVKHVVKNKCRKEDSSVSIYRL